MGCNKPLIRFYVPHNREASGRVYSLASFNEIHKTKMKYEDLMYRKDVMMDANYANAKTGLHEWN